MSKQGRPSVREDAPPLREPGKRTARQQYMDPPLPATEPSWLRRLGQALFCSRVGLAAWLIGASLTVAALPLPATHAAIRAPLAASVGAVGIFLGLWRALERLGLPVAICPHARSNRLCSHTVGRIKIRELRPRLYAAMRHVGEAWAALVQADQLDSQTGALRPSRFQRSPQLARLSMAFLEAYAAEERKDIADNHLVMTNFVAYGAILRSILDELGELYPGYERVLYTQLCMPVSRWFNFRTRPNGNGKLGGDGDLPGERADRLWVDKYLKFLHQHTVVLTEEGGTSVHRFIPVVPEGGTGLAHTFNDPSTLMRDLSAYILTPDSYCEGQFVQPLKHAQIRRLIKELRQTNPSMAAHIDRLYGQAPEAYVILPTATCQTQNGGGWLRVDHTLPPEPRIVDLGDPDGDFKWVAVRTVFCSGFHRHVHDAKVREYDADTVAALANSYPDSRARRLPEDFVLIGVRRRPTDEPDWQCCLAAEVDSEIDKLKLWYLDGEVSDACDSSLNPEGPIFTLNGIIDYVKQELEPQSISVTDWYARRLKSDTFWAGTHAP